MKSKNPFTYKIRLTFNKQNSDFIDWLANQYGPGGIQKDCRWDITPDLSEFDYGEDIMVYFRNESDASLFALRWL